MGIKQPCTHRTRRCTWSVALQYGVSGYAYEHIDALLVVRDLKPQSLTPSGYACSKCAHGRGAHFLPYGMPVTCTWWNSCDW